LQGASQCILKDSKPRKYFGFPCLVSALTQQTENTWSSLEKGHSELQPHSIFYQSRDKSSAFSTRTLTTRPGCLRHIRRAQFHRRLRWKIFARRFSICVYLEWRFAVEMSWKIHPLVVTRRFFPALHANVVFYMHDCVMFFSLAFIFLSPAHRYKHIANIRSSLMSC
jgi:hypothetical protein